MRGIALILTLLAGIVASAQELREPAAKQTGGGPGTVQPSEASPSSGSELLAVPEPEVSFGVYAKPVGAAGTQFTLVLGNNVSRTFKIYAEPSHTLLVAYADNSDGDPREKAWYRDELRGKGGGRMFAPFAPGLRARFEADAAQPSDTHLSLHVFGWYPGEDAPRERVYQVRMPDLRSFGFRMRQLQSDAMICCTKDPDHQNECNTACTKCPTTTVSCCTVNESFNTCGWCKKMKAYCGEVECPGCG
jgi:hypothetical protein